MASRYSAVIGRTLTRDSELASSPRSQVVNRNVHPFIRQYKLAPTKGGDALQLVRSLRTADLVESTRYKTAKFYPGDRISVPAGTILRTMHVSIDCAGKLERQVILSGGATQ